MFPLLTRIDRQLRPAGLVGHHRALELPAHHGDLRRPGRPGRRQRRAAQTGPQTPYAALAAVDLLRAVGMPDDLWQVVYGPGAQVGPELITQVDYVCFTGSTATGRMVAKQCAERLIGCSLELGGKNPLIVLDDADVEKAAAGAVRGSLLQRRPALRLHGADLRRRAGAARRSPRRSWPRPGRCGSVGRWTTSTTWAAWSASSQLERVERHVEDARSKGAQVLTGGRPASRSRSAVLRADGADRRDRRRWTATPGRPSVRW